MAHVPAVVMKAWWKAAMMPSAPPQPQHAPGNGRRIAFALAAMAMMSAGLYGLIVADVIDLAALLTMILLAASAMAWAAKSEERLGGKECVRTGKSRWWLSPYKKKQRQG